MSLPFRDGRGAAANASAATESEKERRMTRMRRAATGLLGCMAVLLFACVVLEERYPWLAWLRSFAEAGTVGAIADWYAVVALFRHPFALPLPHTAIIARNQPRIAESLGRFVEENFLEPELIVAKLGGHNAAKALAQSLSNRANSEIIAAALVESLPGVLDTIDENEAARFIEWMLLPRLRSFDASRAAGRVLSMLAEGDRHRPLVEHGLRALERWLVRHAGVLNAKFSEASRYTPARFDAYVVDRFVAGIVALVQEVAATPDHALRREIDRAFLTFIEQLQTSDTHRRFGKSLLRDCIRQVRRAGHARVVLRRIRRHVAEDAGRERSVTRAIATSMLVSFGDGVARSPALQHTLNAWWLEVARALVVRYRSRLTELITEVVKGWDAAEVSRKIEAEIGRDLQFVRINGTLVGGIAGVLLHAGTLAVAHYAI